MTVLLAALRARFARAPRHRHEWIYGPTMGSGMGIVTCATCPHYDIA